MMANITGRARFAAMGLVGILALTAVACSKSGGRKPVYPVKGKVQFDGRPAEGALVVFHPVGAAGAEGNPHATVAADGTYTLTTYDSGDGAPEGDYLVTVEWWQRDPRQPDNPPLNRLNPQLARTESSGLKARVDKGKNEITPIELKK
jgi:hypothetical protein